MRTGDRLLVMAGLPGFGAALIEKSSSAGVAEERSSHLRRSNSQHGGLRERSQRGQRDHPTISGAQGGSKHNTVHGASDYLRTMSNSQHRESSVHGRPSASGVHQGASDQADVPATSLYAPQLRTSNRAMDAAERALEQTLLVIPGQESSHHSHRSFHPSVHGNRDISQRRGGAIHGSLHGSQVGQCTVTGADSFCSSSSHCTRFLSPPHTRTEPCLQRPACDQSRT